MSSLRMTNFEKHYVETVQYIEVSAERLQIGTISLNDQSGLQLPRAAMFSSPGAAYFLV